MTRPGQPILRQVVARPHRTKPGPRSPVVAGDRSLDAYLVRHNALAAGDGVGGFMPYVDVVTQDAEGGPARATGEERSE